MKTGDDVEYEIEILEKLKGVENVMQIFRMNEKSFITPYYGKTLRPFYNKNDAIFDEISNVISSIHSKGIYHGDLKPSNICLNSEGKITIIDFNFSTSDDENTPRGVTNAYCSINQMCLGNPTKEDDFESLIYTKEYLICGDLAWMKDEDENVIIQKKKKFLDEHNYTPKILFPFRHLPVVNLKFE